MKEYVLNTKESLTVLDMVQDAMDRGMVSNNYETKKLEEIIKENTDEFEKYNKDTEFEVIIRVKTHADSKKSVVPFEQKLLVLYRHPMHGLQWIKCHELINKEGVMHVKNIRGVTFQTLEPGRILSINECK